MNWTYLQATVPTILDPHDVKLPKAVYLYDKESQHIFYSPTIMVWNPITQLDLTIKCPMHQSVALTWHGHYNMDQYNKPRKIYDIGQIIHLVSAKYKCTDHTIIGTDEGILQQVTKVIDIPFILTHRSGMTADLKEYVYER